MSKKYTILYMIILMTVLFAFSSCGNHNHPTPNPPPVDAYHGWTSPQITTNSPGDKILNNIAFPYEVNIRNNGAYNMTSALISVGTTNSLFVNPLSGIYLSDDKILSMQYLLSNSHQIVIGVNNMPGVSQANPLGSTYSAKITVKPLIPEVSLPQTENIFDFACMNYANSFNDPSMCISPDSYGQNKNSACVSEPKKTYSGQGGPVGVSSVSIKVAPSGTPDYSTITVEFYISNKGNGQVVSPKNSLSDCISSTALKSSDFNVVHINSAKLGDTILSCSYANPYNDYSNYQRISYADDNNQQQYMPFICTSQPVKLEHAYLTTLTLNFNYIYCEYIKDSFTIYPSS